MFAGKPSCWADGAPCPAFTLALQGLDLQEQRPGSWIVGNEGFLPELLPPCLPSLCRFPIHLDGEKESPPTNQSTSSQILVEHLLCTGNLKKYETQSPPSPGSQRAWETLPPDKVVSVGQVLSHRRLGPSSTQWVWGGDANTGPGGGHVGAVRGRRGWRRAASVQEQRQHGEKCLTFTAKQDRTRGFKHGKCV